MGFGQKYSYTHAYSHRTGDFMRSGCILGGGGAFKQPGGDVYGRVAGRGCLDALPTLGDHSVKSPPRDGQEK